jgi:cell division septation protein DedD
MKNVHKIRGKREFLFDDRELLVLGGGACVICVLIFVLGFLMGQGFQEKTIASPLNSEDYISNEEDFASVESGTSDTLVAEDTPQEEVSASEKKSQLSYYQVLPDSETYVEVEATPVNESTPAPSASEESEPEQAESDVSQQEVKKEAPSGPSPTATPPSSQDAAAAPALPNVPKSPTDVMQVGRPVHHLEEGTIPTGTAYSVQVSSSSNRTDSERLQQKYVELGYRAYVMPADLGERGVWYRVLVGNFATREEAEQLKQEILNNTGYLANDPLIKVIE